MLPVTANTWAAYAYPKGYHSRRGASLLLAGRFCEGWLTSAGPR